MKNRKEVLVMLNEVKYVPGLYCYLISITQLLKKDFELADTKNYIALKKGKTELVFDKKVKSVKGVIFGLEIIGTWNKLVKELVQKSVGVSKINLHEMFGHASRAVTSETTKKFNYRVSLKVDIACKDYALGKQRQKNVGKTTDRKYTTQGEMMYMDISSVNQVSQGGKKFMVLWCDAATKMWFTQFLSKKSDLQDSGIKFIGKLRDQYGVKVQCVRCDNAGENMKLKEKLHEMHYGVKFKITAAGTPQHNGVVERAFATMYGRVRSMLNGPRLSASLRSWLWAECATVAIQVHNLLVNKSNEKCAYEKFCKSVPKYAKHLRVFGEMGTVRAYDKKIKAKLENRGPCVCLLATQIATRETCIVCTILAHEA